MKKKIPKKIQRPEQQQKEEEIQIVDNQQQSQITDVSLRPRMIKKNSLFVTFTGSIQSGFFNQYKHFSLYYSITAGPDWKILNGNRTGLTQVASCDNQKITWNFPFQISYQTTVLAGWPQLLVVLYASDFFGKPYVQGYGNVHLPTDGGIQNRKLRIFNPQPRSIISGILGYFQGTIAQYRDFEKVLAYGDGREVTRTKTIGLIKIKVQTSKYNFTKFGYQ